MLITSGLLGLFWLAYELKQPGRQWRAAVAAVITVLSFQTGPIADLIAQIPVIFDSIVMALYNAVINFAPGGGTGADGAGTTTTTVGSIVSTFGHLGPFGGLG